MDKATQMGLFKQDDSAPVLLKRISPMGIGSSKKREYHIEYRKKNKEKIKAYNDRPDVKRRSKLHMIQYNYGVTPEWYLAQIESQGGKCAICGIDLEELGDRHICVDHDHETGTVREILCSNCNHALGNVSESVEVAEKLIKYLRKHKLLSS